MEEISAVDQRNQIHPPANLFLSTRPTLLSAKGFSLEKFKIENPYNFMAVNISCFKVST